jgi:hypothetical protein
MPDFSFLEGDNSGGDDDVKVAPWRQGRRATAKRGKKPQLTNEQLAKWVGAPLVVVFLFMVGVLSNPGNQRDFDAKDNRTLAVMCAQDHVKSMLKAPASAQWPGAFRGVDIAEHARKNADGTYDVESYVDAQNSFGAMIRTRYFVRLSVHNDGGYTVKKAFLIE